MSRTIPSAIVSALGDDSLEIFYAVDLDFDAGNMRMWTGYGDKTINGQTYTGTGNLLQIDGLEEASDLSAKGTTLTLNGIDSTIVSRALAEEYQGRLCTIYWGVVGVTDVLEVFSGYMDTMTINDSGETSTISLTVESRLIALERANVRRYTSESHKATRTAKGLSGSDTFFDWVTKLQDKQVVWGRTTESGNETS